MEKKNVAYLYEKQLQNLDNWEKVRKQRDHYKEKAEKMENEALFFKVCAFAAGGILFLQMILHVIEVWT